LYPNSGGFESRGAAVDVASPDGLEEVVDVDPYGVQWQAWRCPVLACLSAQGWL
jgi:hypothetical protein